MVYHRLPSPVIRAADSPAADQEYGFVDFPLPKPIVGADSGMLSASRPKMDNQAPSDLPDTAMRKRQDGSNVKKHQREASFVYYCEKTEFPPPPPALQKKFRGKYECRLERYTELPEALKQNLAARDVTHLSLVQHGILENTLGRPPVRNEKIEGPDRRFADLIVSFQPGIGKTYAYLIPLITWLSGKTKDGTAMVADRTPSDVLERVEFIG
ncbi:MAG: hypothetical protein Q9208_007578 [Pyrenodesmia sp. 3 TL-2023]